jgi:quercetin dioxygenase-like cupin family protein
MNKHPDQDPFPADGDDPVYAEIGEALRPVEPPPDRAAALRARVLDRIRQEGRTQAMDFKTIRSEEGWFQLAPKIQKKVLYVDREAGTEAYLLRVEPGAEAPPHSHARDELCVVLEGEVAFDDLRLRAGDFHMAMGGSTHSAARSETGAVIYIQGALEDRHA